MSKVYIVSKWSIYDGSRPIAVSLDEKKCDELIAEKNKEWNEEEEQFKKCRKCRYSDFYDHPESNTFLLKDTCEFAKIETDRYGMYCEHDKSNDCGRSSSYYSKCEVDLID